MDAELQDVSEVLHDEADLSALELADGLLENVVHCPDCSKPVLQSALEDHAATCQAIREGRPPPTSHPLKRRLSEVSNTSSSQPPKKSKLVVHLSGAAPDKAKPPTAPQAPSTAPSIVDVDRQCGVINDKGYPCPRSLTCKTHNMSAKRAVPHRSHPFDILLFEWQKASKANQQRAEAAKQMNQSSDGGGAPTPGSAGDGTAAGAAGAAAGTNAAAPSLARDPSASSMIGLDAPPRPKKRKSGMTGGGGGVNNNEAGGALTSSTTLTSSGLFPKTASERRAKKGIVYVGEWEESDDDAADELVDSDDEVEATLRGLARVERGRPLILQRGGGAGFAAASLWTGRNTKLNRLRDTLRDVFRPRG
ncbi:SCA7-domain-containing protein [Rhodotorula sp. JG-1b]|nr:SCA7-domain-containing protein [Rhodotorula sp. JG-1b]